MTSGRWRCQFLERFCGVGEELGVDFGTGLQPVTPLYYLSPSQTVWEYLRTSSRFNDLIAVSRMCLLALVDGLPDHGGNQC